jgi:hypothetical protein
MARKAKNPTAPEEGRPLQEVVRRPRICFERIIPDPQDPERHVRRALRGEMLSAAANGAGRLDPEKVAHVTRMALIASKKWPKGAVVRCRFLDGSAKMRKKVRTLCKEWEQYANVTLKFVAKGPAEVRISFYADDGSWSAVGRDALNTAYFPLHQPTMNFGWVRDDSDAEEDRAVILHEFGHALGCIHEHQGPEFGRKWNRAEVMKYFMGPPNYWDEDAISSNVLSKYPPKGILTTKYDPRSIMLYSFDGELFADGLGPTNENTRLSQLDRKMIREMYPR